jgi:ubiquinol-cytochrome c reductase cytochrome b subunit
VEDPFILTGQILTVVYFAYYITLPIITKYWDTLNK